MDKKNRSVLREQSTLLILTCVTLFLAGIILSTLLIANAKSEDRPSKAVVKHEQAKKPFKPKSVEKSQAAKQAVMAHDLERMNALNLYYDYPNLSLAATVKAYLQEYGIDPSQVAFSYKDVRTGKTDGMNEVVPMTAGSTYKLPLNMLVLDEVAKGKLSLTERFDITHTTYEYQGEHAAYVSQFKGAMTIPQMQEYSLVYSENTPAYALAERLGGLDQAFKAFDRYGKSRSKELPTIARAGNKTTASYYLQVLDYLWKHQDSYKPILDCIGRSFPGQYYKTYLPDLIIYQKPGYVHEALNVAAIVMEKSPYLVAIYTRQLGGTTPESQEISPLGYNQLAALTYVINEWHRVNQNP
ncbi:serine hydrolase [Streptococcus halichoeri]|uniref:serine hydrolase n=1 Tax=Streptococcus halichoeri TaxID=254785 RepID=UPI001F39E05B|nr:serine hydrolase [Streptococcus halichoeri]